MTAGRPWLRALSVRLGVVDTYWDLTGARRDTPDATREAICGAMGRDGSGEEEARRTLAALEDEARARVLEPVRVWRERAGPAPDLAVRHPGAGGPLRARVELTDDRGRARVRELELPWAPAGHEIRLPLPGRPDPGVYRVALEWHGGPEARGGRAEQVLVVVPRTAFGVRDALGPGRAFGVWTNLYTLRSERNLGFGNLGDLAALARLCAEWGGDFVGLSPLHAIPNRAHDVSPYSPLSRLYRSPLYLDVESVPELAESPAARARLAAPATRQAIARLRVAAVIDYEAVLALVTGVLRELHATFCERRGSERGRAYSAYLEREGRALADFATFEVLAAEHGDSDWRRWPEPWRDARGAAVARFRAEHAREIDFRSWLQFELERQLGQAAAAGHAAGLRLGLYADLAVGSTPGSADVWSFPQAFASGVHLGAPPDAFAPEGQDWGLAPLDPHRLRADGYRLFARLLSSSMCHAGALRIDHVLGLQRLFWIPDGRPAREGAYVLQPRDELLGVVALESRRARTVVVGEDLGTVPPELPGELASWGILSSSVLVFERDGDTFRPACEVSSRALACAVTHDLAPLAGYVASRDLELRRRAGELADEAAFAAALAARRAEVEAWARRLREEGVVPAGADLAPASGAAASAGAPAPGAAIPPRPSPWCRATSAFLARTPAPLVAVSLDDLAGESEPVNLPGIGAERHPSWRRRMAASLEALAASPEVRAGLPTLREGPVRGTLPVAPPPGGGETR